MVSTSNVNALLFRSSFLTRKVFLLMLNFRLSQAHVLKVLEYK
jgi:hypothetical protein